MNRSTLMGPMIATLVGLGPIVPAHAGLLNTTFDDDLADWEIVRVSEGPGGLEFDFPAPTAQAQVTGGGGSATISNDDTYFEVALSQFFDVAADATGTLEFDYVWSAGISNVDGFVPDNIIQGALFQASDFSPVETLFASSYGTFADSGSVRVDLSTWAGQSLVLDFTVSDFDFVTGDSLTISNLRINRPGIGVPGPATALLIPLALAGLATRRR